VVFGGMFPFKGAGGAGATPTGGKGGDGSAGLTAPAMGGVANTLGGGGGGGGAPGYILIYTPDGGLENATTQITPTYGP
jgi:hypothetical protein